MNIGVILAGGNGTRVGANIPKQFIKIMNKPILAYTLEIFQKCTYIDAIEIVYNRNWLSEINNIVKKYNIYKTKWLIPGGLTFQESVKNGIFNLRDKIKKTDIVVISFGVSPITPNSDIIDSINICQKYGNAIASKDIDLCTCIKDNNFSTTQNLIREKIKGFSNPWTFNFGEICEAYEIAESKGILNKIEPHTTSLYFALGKRLWFSKSTSKINKITTREDLELFEGILLLEKEKKSRDLDNKIEEKNKC